MSGQPSFSADSGPGATSDLTAETAREAMGQRARNWTSSQCGRPRNGVRYPPTGWPKWPCCACWRRKPGRTPGPNRACQHENAQCQHRMGFGHEANPKVLHATARGCAACTRQDARRSRTRWQLRDKSRVWVDWSHSSGRVQSQAGECNTNPVCLEHHWLSIGPSSGVGRIQCRSPRHHCLAGNGRFSSQQRPVWCVGITLDRYGHCRTGTGDVGAGRLGSGGRHRMAPRPPSIAG